MRITYRVFTGTRGFFWTQRALLAHRDRVRRQAADFINQEVGPENVVSVAEPASPGAWPFGVTVWYREADSSARYVPPAQA